MLHPLLLSEILGPAIAGFSQFQREIIGEWCVIVAVLDIEKVRLRRIREFYAVTEVSIATRSA